MAGPPGARSEPAALGRDAERERDAEAEPGEAGERVDDGRAPGRRQAAADAPDRATPGRRRDGGLRAHAGNPGVMRTWSSARMVIAS